MQVLNQCTIHKDIYLTSVCYVDASISGAGLGLQNAGSGQARALHCGLGLFAGLGAYLVKSGSDSGFY
jgi:hypothetical protein